MKIEREEFEASFLVGGMILYIKVSTMRRLQPINTVKKAVGYKTNTQSSAAFLGGSANLYGHCGTQCGRFSGSWE